MSALTVEINLIQRRNKKSMVKTERMKKKSSQMSKIKKILIITMKIKNASLKMMKNKQIYSSNLANSGMQSVKKLKSKNMLSNN